jgi:hypothetical protein
MHEVDLHVVMMVKQCQQGQGRTSASIKVETSIRKKQIHTSNEEKHIVFPMIAIHHG